MPRAGGCLPLLGSVVGDALVSRIIFLLCMGLQKKPPFSEQSIVQTFDTIGFNTIYRIITPHRGTSSLDVTGFTTPRYPSVYFSFRLFLPLSFFAIFFFPSRVGEGALHEKQLPLCLLLASHGQQITPTCWPCVATH
ncbi:hypothetical protein AVEN_23023-1 [Araneus ventricosus]|uniref:Uncharacterized protein n=1 Tax=Araneus ventricosus TaxID=182803 RepID=A0A4Y2LMJ0_ARAVE|nr:hypothetical protein AVEN_23023-1 [Araneus ventricosus]